MTFYTNQMKVAPSLAKKIKVVQEMSEQPRFADTNKQYNKMKVAKEMLAKRILEKANKGKPSINHSSESVTNSSETSMSQE